MAKDVAVFNVPPLYVQGLTAISNDSGYRFEPVSDPTAWVALHEHPAVLVGVRDGHDLDVVVELVDEDPDLIVVTVVDDYDMGTVRKALDAGAVSAVSRDAAITDIVLALNAAVIESTVIPIAFARRLAADTAEEESPSLEQHELDWLQAIARNTTIASLGRNVGYSEREMHRRLRAVYSKMGVHNRTEALVKASRLGWIR